MINTNAISPEVQRKNWNQFYLVFVFNETPAGTVNGSNKVFTLIDPPYQGKYQVFKNGLLLKPTTDYAVSGKTITFVSAPAGGAVLLAHYMR